MFFTTPHFNGYPAVLLRIRDLARVERAELRDRVVGAWLTRAQKRVAKAWLAEHEPADASGVEDAGLLLSAQLRQPPATTETTCCYCHCYCQGGKE